LRTGKGGVGRGGLMTKTCLARLSWGPRDGGFRGERTRRRGREK